MTTSSTTGTRRIAAAWLLLALSAGPACAVPDIVRTSTFDYDPSTGLLTKEVVEPNISTLCLVKTYEYDSFGNKKRVVERNCNGSAGVFTNALAEGSAPAGGSTAVITSRESTATYTYSTDGNVTVASVNAQGHTQTAVISGAWGQALSQAGPNYVADGSGNPQYLKTEAAYDTLGRKVLEKRPDGNGTSWAYTFYSTSTGAPQVSAPVGITGVTAYVVTETPVKAPIDLVAKTSGGANGAYSRTYYDALHRVIRVESQGFDGDGTSRLVLQDTAYDAVGRKVAVSAPYYSGDTAYWTQYQYDKMGRTLLATAPNQSKTTTTYAGLVTTVTNDLGQATTKTKDAAGQIAQVTDAYGKNLTLAYDAVGNVLTSTDSLGNVVSTEYDGRGRKKKLTDPDMGQWTYEVDVAGNLRKQTDNKNQVTTMTYDRIDRLLTKSEPSLNTTWVYDSCPQGIGQLCTATGDNSYERSHSYDTVGRPLSTTVKVLGTAYTSSVGYDSNGRVSTTVYPSGGLTTKNVYTSLGFLLQVQDATRLQADGVTPVQYWQALQMDARGHLTQQKLGSVTSADTFDPLTGWLKTTAAGPNNSVENISYTYDTLGNLKTRNDAVTGINANYTYDDLNRLKTETRTGGAMGTILYATVFVPIPIDDDLSIVIPAKQAVGPSPQTITWDYDDIGNLKSRSDVGTYTYNPSGAGSVRPHAVTGVTGTVNGGGNPTYHYDNNGNLDTVTANGDSHSATWTSFNKTSSVSRTFGGNTNTLAYLYDPERDRVREVYTRNGVQQRTTVYVNAGATPFYEEETGVAGTKRKHYLSAGGNVVGMLTLDAGNAITGQQFWHKDHLGSVVVVTDASGTPVERMAYEPFGKRRSADGPTDLSGTLAPTSTDRGYTGHEQMDEVGLINMNGRIYDPSISRFLSADPTIPAPEYGQAYNRYAYTVNNPLKYFDPSGFEPWAVTGGEGGGNTSFVASGNGYAVDSYTGNYYAAADSGGAASAQFAANPGMAVAASSLSSGGNAFGYVAAYTGDQAGLPMWTTYDVRGIPEGAWTPRAAKKTEPTRLDLLKDAAASAMQLVDEFTNALGPAGAPVMEIKTATIGLAALVKLGRGTEAVSDASAAVRGVTEAGEAAKEAGGIWRASKIDAAKMEHIFSADHVKTGIMDLGKSKDAILNQARDALMAADKAGGLREGMNTVVTRMNGYDATVRAFIKNGEMQSMNLFKGISERAGQYVVDLR